MPAGVLTIPSGPVSVCFPSSQEWRNAQLIEELQTDTSEENEYALYVKALILRAKHKIN